jgi:hypothetical protein
VDFYDSEYRRQYCRERIGQIRDDYRRVQRPPKEEQREPIGIVQARSIWKRVRRQIPNRVPVYRS